MGLTELRNVSLFAGLTDEQFAELVAAGSEVEVHPGVELFHEGNQADCWWVLIEGAIDLVRHVGREETVVGRMETPGRWAGGFRAWDADGVYLATGRGALSGRVLRIPAEVLREKVDAWFPFGCHLIAGLYHTARSIEATARQRDALVTLGTLAAGLAHEINNPAAAGARAADALDAACKTLLSSLGRLADGEISAAQFSTLNALRQQIRPPAQPPDALTLADHEALLSSWLSQHDITRPWLLAAPLAAAGVDLDWCERAADAVQGSALEPALEWVASTLSAAILLREVKDSTRRVSDLVAAVKSYSQMDRAAIQTIDVTEGLEATLLMLGHKLGPDVAVVRDYATDLPRIEAYASELNQVWTNLIDNAIDAVDGSGTLRLRTHALTDQIVVEIADDGAGMPAEVAERAFEPFFTTKDVGKGTGLGLDIARRIVTERHHGAITIDSRPGDTVLRVQLPVRHATL